MNALMHYFGGGICLFGAAVLAMKANDSEKAEDGILMDEQGRGKISRHEKSDNHDSSTPQKRTVESRLADVSMATRFRPVGTVTVGGHVKTPGSVPMTANMTLWRAIQLAGGATEFGSLRSVSLCRDGKRMSYDVTKEAWQNVILRRNDTIEVPQKFGS